MYTKIKQYLNTQYLSWVVLDSLSQAKIVSLMSRLNIDYPGVRITSIPAQDLAFDLAEEAFAHPEMMDILIKNLSEVNAEGMQKISLMADKEIKAWLRRPKILRQLKIGKILWALLFDSRPAVNELIPDFLKSVERLMEQERFFLKQMEDEADKIDSILSSRKGLRKLEQSISLFKTELSREQKISMDLRQENERLQDKIIQQQGLIQQLRKLNGELTQEKGKWHKERLKKEKEVENLYQQIRQLKQQLTVGPKMRLKAEIHHLQKENNKFYYLLEKERQENSAKMRDLQRQLEQLKENQQELEKVNLQRQQQLEKQTDEFKELQKEYQHLLDKKEPSLFQPPKEKGKRLGIFIDNQNVYYSSKRHYGKKLDYRRLQEVLVKDRHLVKAICYIVQHPEIDHGGFIDMLKNNGYVVRTRDLILRADGSAKGNWDIGIATDVITLVEKNNLDIVSLVTCDGDFVDLVKLLSAKGIRVEVVGFPMNMAMDLKKVADEYYFITEDLMVGEG